MNGCAARLRLTQGYHRTAVSESEMFKGHCLLVATTLPRPGCCSDLLAALTKEHVSRSVLASAATRQHEACVNVTRQHRGPQHLVWWTPLRRPTLDTPHMSLVGQHAVLSCSQLLTLFNHISAGGSGACSLWTDKSPSLSTQPITRAFTLTHTST